MEARKYGSVRGGEGKKSNEKSSVALSLMCCCCQSVTGALGFSSSLTLLDHHLPLFVIIDQSLFAELLLVSLYCYEYMSTPASISCINYDRNYERYILILYSQSCLQAFCCISTGIYGECCSFKPRSLLTTI